MFLPAVFGIKSSGLNLAANLVILFLVVVWLALIYWTYADARRRVGDQMLVWCATAASFFPFVGTIVYMIVRPPEYLEDVRERELEMQAVEARLAQLGYQLCPHCDAEVEKDFLRCPSCLRKLKDPCRTCGKPLDPSWKICPFCESEVGAMTSTPRRARRRREAPSPSAAGSPSPAASGPAPSPSASGPAPSPSASGPAPSRAASATAPSPAASRPAPSTAEPPAAGQTRIT